MTGIVAMLDGRNWTAIAHELDVEGYALLPGLLTPAQARELANAAPATAPTARASASADSGELFGHAPTAPAAWMPWRKAFYRHLAPIANRWQQILDDPLRYPAELPEFLARNRAAGQTRPLSRLQRLRQGRRGGPASARRRRLRLSAAGRGLAVRARTGFHRWRIRHDRAASAHAIAPHRAAAGHRRRRHHRHGSAAVQGGAGYYRVNLKHAISRVRDGERVGLELLLHDAP